MRIDWQPSTFRPDLRVPSLATTSIHTSIDGVSLYLANVAEPLPWQLTASYSEPMSETERAHIKALSLVKRVRYLQERIDYAATAMREFATRPSDDDVAAWLTRVRPHLLTLYAALKSDEKTVEPSARRR